MTWSTEPKAARPVSLAVEDERPAAARPFHVGEFEVEAVGMGDEIEYLRTNLEQVLRSYGVEIQRADAGSADLVLRVRKFRMRNEEGGFTGYHTFTTFRGDLTAAGKSYPITAYFKATRIADENYDLVRRPCYQVPINAVVQEVAAKINHAVLGYRVPDFELKALIDEVPTGRISITDAGLRNVWQNNYTISEEFFKVLRLGYSNNPTAIPALLQMADRKEVLMRGAAVSSIGMLGADDQLPRLQEIYARDRDLGRLMALKSIGDLDTPDSRAFLDTVRRSKTDALVQEVLDLYD